MTVETHTHEPCYPSSQQRARETRLAQNDLVPALPPRLLVLSDQMKEFKLPTSRGERSSGPWEDHPSPLLLPPSATTLSCLDTFLDQRVMPVPFVERMICPGHLAKYSTHLTSVYSHSNPGEELSTACDSSLLLELHRRPLPPQHPGHE